MSLALRLRGLLSNPGSFSALPGYLELEGGQNRTLFIWGPDLVNACLKSPSIVTFDFLSHWKSLAAPTGIPEIEALFSNTPLLLNGSKHREVRHGFGRPYRDVERLLSQILSRASKDYFREHAQTISKDPIQFVRGYVATMFLKMVSPPDFEPAEDDVRTVAQLSASIFKLFPTQRSVLNYEKNVQELRQFMIRIGEQNGQSADDIWLLMSMLVMGQEPLLGALTYRLAHAKDPRLRSASDLIDEVCPVQVVFRRVEADVQFDGLSLAKGEHVYLRLADNALDGCPESDIVANKRKAVPFGAGVHVCPGKNISLAIAQSFLDELDRENLSVVGGVSLDFVRDVAVLVREKRNG